VADYCFLERLVDMLSPPDLRPIIQLGPIVEQVGPLVSTASPGPHLFHLHRRRLLFMFPMTDSQETTMTIKEFRDKKDNPVPNTAIDGVPEWLTDNPNLLELTPAADGLSCKVRSVGPLGTATVSMKADVDPSVGQSFVAGRVDVEVTFGTPTTVVLDPGTPTEQP